jgi:hypothetical protein
MTSCSVKGVFQHRGQPGVDGVRQHGVDAIQPAPGHFVR